MVTAPLGTDLYEEQMRRLAQQETVRNIPRAPVEQTPLQTQQPQLFSKDDGEKTYAQKFKEQKMEEAANQTANHILENEMVQKVLAAVGIPFFSSSGAHVGPLGAKYYSTGTVPNLFGNTYDQDLPRQGPLTQDESELSDSINALNELSRPTVGPKTSSGGLGGLLSGLFNSPVFSPLTNLTSGVSQWAGEAFPAAESSAAAKAISAEANKGKNPIGADSWTWNIGNRNFTTTTPAKAHETGKIADWQYMNTLKNTGGSPYAGFKGATNAAIPGARGATPIYDKATDKTSWFYNPSPQQLHPHLKSDGGKIGPLDVQYHSTGSDPYRGLFKRQAALTNDYINASKKGSKTGIQNILKQYAATNPAAGIQNIINNAPKNYATNANIMRMLGRLNPAALTGSLVFSPTQAAKSTRDPVDAAPMGLEAEMFERQAAINEAKKRAGQEQFMEQSGFGGLSQAMQEAFEAGKESVKKGSKKAKDAAKDLGKLVMPKVIEKAGGLVDMLAPLAPPSRSLNPRQGYESGQDKGPTPNWSETFPPTFPNYMAPPTSGIDMNYLAPLAPPSRSANPRQGYESGEDRGQMYSSPRVYET